MLVPLDAEDELEAVVELAELDDVLVLVDEVLELDAVELPAQTHTSNPDPSARQLWAPVSPLGHAQARDWPGMQTFPDAFEVVAGAPPAPPSMTVVLHPTNNRPIPTNDSQLDTDFMDVLPRLRGPRWAPRDRAPCGQGTATSSQLNGRARAGPGVAAMIGLDRAPELVSCLPVSRSEHEA